MPKRNTAQSAILLANQQQMQELLVHSSTLLKRLELSQATTGKTFNGDRDMYAVLGYQKDIEFDHYLGHYLRQDVAQRIINAYPDATWIKGITIEQDEDKQEESPFEEQFNELARRTKLFHYLNRTDRLAGLGRYSVLLVGVRDNITDLSQPMGRLNSIDDVMYLTPFSEKNATIKTYEQDMRNPRYGLPVTYQITTGGYSGQPSQSLLVHHSRLLHVAEGTLENDILGVPRLQSVFNRLMDLEKVVGGSAEIYWLNGRGGLSVNSDSDVQIDDPEKLEEHIQAYIHKLTRILKTRGMDVKTLELSIYPPDKHVAVILDLISSATGIPKRILTGSERGELASGQDENNWLSRVDERRNNFCEPLILRPLIDMLMNAGALPQVDTYKIAWPDLISPSEKDRAEVAAKIAQAVATYANSPQAGFVVPTQQFVQDVLGLEYRQDDIIGALDEESKQIEADKQALEDGLKEEGKNAD